MNKEITITNHKSLKRYMLTLESDMREKKSAIKEDAKNIALGFPNRLFHHSSSLENLMNNKNVVSNPIGKLLSTVVKNTILKKSGFLVKLLGGIFAKRAGKTVEKRLLN